MHKIIRDGHVALIMALACLPVFGAECETHTVGGLTFSNCHERESEHVLAGRFELSNATSEKRVTPSVPVLAGKKGEFVFSEINPIPAVLTDAELEKARATKPLDAKKKPISKIKKTGKKSVRKKTKPSH